jgi:hypothetical protein
MRALIWGIALTACVGCSVDSVAWDRAVRPIAAPGSSPAFADKVDVAVLVWERALGCSDVFSGASGTAPIYEMAPSEFASIDLGPTVSGETWQDKVWISSARPEMEDEILVHELGHVLGLEHVVPSDDPSSVMHATDDGIVRPDTRDTENVGCR